jgi:hypothetical protein
MARAYFRLSSFFERAFVRRKPSHSHPDVGVLALYEASRNVALARVANSHLGYNLDDWAWGVPFSSMLAIVAVQLK